MNCMRLLELVGVLVGSYGLVREAFATLAQARPHGEGRYGEGPYGGSSSRVVSTLLSVGRVLKLIPRDGNLTLTDRKLNAALAVAGVLMVVVSLVAELALAM